ncbi:MAG: uroporphyrinogen-III synthase [Candidatus Omnitrophota bacterium]|jgi:uroporphyrinogen III methyltransferase/synthase
MAKAERRPLEGKTVLVTRARAQAASLLRGLKKLGARAVCFSVIRILGPASWTPLDRVLRSLGEFDRILFTSANGVEFFLRRLNQKKVSLKSLRRVPLGAIGDGTAAALAAAGLRAGVVPDRFTSEGLYRALKEKRQIRGRSFLLLRADIATAFLPRALRRDGAKVTEVTVYRTVPSGRGKAREHLRRDLLAGKIDFVTLTSASTVRHFFSLLPRSLWKKMKCRFVSIGPVTSRALREYGHKSALEAKTHNLAGLLEALSP